MSKPRTADGYDEQVTDNCERVLVTLLRNLGPWRESMVLVGGLTPRYLIARRPPDIPAHAGTGDIDVVVSLEMLADTKAYRSLEANLKKMGFVRGTNENGVKISWCWEVAVDPKAKIRLELLADDPASQRIVELPNKGNVSALNIPHASIVFDNHEEREIKAELLDEGGIATVTLRHANLSGFVVLKTFALDQRDEPKDAHDLVYCIEHFEGGLSAAAALMKAAMAGKHKDTVEEALRLLARHFADEGNTEGYTKSGPVAVAQFELGRDPEQRDARILRQRDAADIVMRFLQEVRAA